MNADLPTQLPPNALSGLSSNFAAAAASVAKHEASLGESAPIPSESRQGSRAFCNGAASVSLSVAVFDSHKYDSGPLKEACAKARQNPHPDKPPLSIDLRFLESHLDVHTAALAKGCEAVCVFVNDKISAQVLQELKSLGVRLVALRCAGYNNVDLQAAKRLGIAVARVPEYSPHAIAEHAVALLLALNRKLVRATQRVRDGNFLLEGLVGFDLFGKTVGVVGTGKIGAAFARIMRGFGCRLLATDPVRNDALAEELGLQYCDLPFLLEQSDVVSLHLPLTPESWHLLNADSIGRLKHGATLINTGRGGLIETEALIAALKSGGVGAAGLDVYEEEEGVFFADHSGTVLTDEKLAWLLMCPNVLITAHQAFLTQEALQQLATVTVRNLSALANGEVPKQGDVDGQRWLAGF
jgi:D-lactate dehydrogenase